MSILSRYGVVALGAALTIAGIVLLALPTGPIEFGWTAYAPLSKTAFVPPEYEPPAFVGGMVILVLGIALIAGWVGYRIALHKTAR